MDSKALRLIGMAMKARRIEVGVDPVTGLIASGRARLVLVASDASPRARQRLESFAEEAEVEFFTAPFDKFELGSVLGRAECAAVGTADAGFSRAIRAALISQSN